MTFSPRLAPAALALAVSVFAGIAGIAGGAALAADTPAPSPAPLSAEQVLARRQIGDLRASPGGERIAFTVTEPPSGERARRHVWVLDVRTRAVRQFTNSAKSEWSPRWSPDGAGLAFLS